jgi:hypothetical protein
MLDGITASGPQKSLWVIDLQEYEPNTRSLYDLIVSGLCPKCVEKLTKKGTNVNHSDLLKTIQNCCGKTPEFVKPKMPILESVFRVLLANGNKPMDIDEIYQQLSERLGSDSYLGLPIMLTCLMDKDKWYGFKKFNG